MTYRDDHISRFPLVVSVTIICHKTLIFTILIQKMLTNDIFIWKNSRPFQRLPFISKFRPNCLFHSLTIRANGMFNEYVTKRQVRKWTSGLGETGVVIQSVRLNYTCGRLYAHASYLTVWQTKVSSFAIMNRAWVLQICVLIKNPLLSLEVAISWRFTAHGKCFTGRFSVNQTRTRVPEIK